MDNLVKTNVANEVQIFIEDAIATASRLVESADTPIDYAAIEKMSSKERRELISAANESLLGLQDTFKKFDEPAQVFIGARALTQAQVDALTVLNGVITACFTKASDLIAFATFGGGSAWVN